jgi:Uma2 family endonuclease
MLGTRTALLGGIDRVLGRGEAHAVDGPVDGPPRGVAQSHQGDRRQDGRGDQRHHEDRESPPPNAPRPAVMIPAHAATDTLPAERGERKGPTCECVSRPGGENTAQPASTPRPRRTLRSVTTVAERLTAHDYLAREDRRRTELIDGLVVVNEPTVLHQRVCALIWKMLDSWSTTTEGRGTPSWPINVPLDEANVLAPDVLWFEAPLDLNEANAPRPPDLAVEVRSPSTWRYDIARKRELYETHGVRELWLADTASRTLLVYRRSHPKAGFDVAHELGPADALTTPLLPGFAATVGDLIPAAS